MLLESYNPVAITETWWTNLITEVQLLLARGSSEETGKEGEVEESPSMSRGIVSEE